MTDSAAIAAAGQTLLRHFQQDALAEPAALRVQFTEVSDRAAIPITLSPENVRMGCTSDDVNNILVFRQNLRQRLNNVLNSLVRRQQSEGEEHRFAFHSEQIFEVSGIDKSYVGDAMRDQVDFGERRVVNLL